MGSQPRTRFETLPAAKTSNLTSVIIFQYNYPAAPGSEPKCLQMQLNSIHFSAVGGLHAMKIMRLEFFFKKFNYKLHRRMYSTECIFRILICQQD